ncbi:MAG: hypothetical protein ACI8P3_004326 [Saprospiraceae bacterium]
MITPACEIAPKQPYKTVDIYITNEAIIFLSYAFHAIAMMIYRFTEIGAKELFPF